MNIPHTPSSELSSILAAQAREAEWYAGAPAMKTAGDIESAIARGEAVRVPDIGVGYKLSEKIPVEFRVLNPAAHALLVEIAREWREQIARDHVTAADDVFLVVSSLARTEAYQQELVAQGYPAATDSTHTKLGAFDIATTWFANNRPELLVPLKKILTEYAAKDAINFIEEPTIGAYHVALNPASLISPTIS